MQLQEKKVACSKEKLCIYLCICTYVCMYMYVVLCMYVCKLYIISVLTQTVYYRYNTHDCVSLIVMYILLLELNQATQAFE